MRRKPACSSIVRATHQAIMADGEGAALPNFALACSRATRIGSQRQSISKLAATTVSSRLVIAGERAGGRTLPCISVGVEAATEAGAGADFATGADTGIGAAVAGFFNAGASVSSAATLAASPVTRAMSWPMRTVSSILIRHDLNVPVNEDSTG